jgi:SOS response regulatory protein OraA/RecX
MIDPSQTLDYLKSQILKLVSGYRELPIGKIREKVFSSLYRKGYELDDISIAWHAVRNSVD